MEAQEVFKSRIDLEKLEESSRKVMEQIGRVIIGQKTLTERMMIAIMANGHVLIEGVPGVAKTLAARLMARCISSGFSRIQFTPDLMPSDVLGTSVFNIGKSEFVFNRGPVFSNIILIDEINRAPAKTQSALFEVMQERQVTVDGTTYIMDEPFIVFATQNPIEHEGTYRLPEAQLDRFLFKINVGYPSLEEEQMILLSGHERGGKKETEGVDPILTGEEIKKYQEIIHGIIVDQNIVNYIARIIDKTRRNSALFLGASPRASLNLMVSCKACAAVRGRDFVTPEDVQEMAYPVLCHRIQLTPEKEMEGSKPEDVIRAIIESTEVPR